MTGALPFESYVDAIGEELERIERLAARGLDSPVPSCPGWVVADVVAHVVTACRQWAVQVEAADAEAFTEPGPAAGRGGRAGRDARDAAARARATAAVRDDLEPAAAALLAALEHSGPLAPCWNWSGSDLVAGWVARRLAIELALHRVDCEQAFGRSTPIERELAVDGVDERLDVHLRSNLGRVPGRVLGGSMCLVASDADASWTVESTRGQIRWRRARGPADVVLVATASELLQFLWNRVDADVLARTGRREVAIAWRSVPA